MQVKHAEQNIVWGLLALQTGLVGDEQVIEGLQHCSSGSHASLGDALHDSMHLPEATKQVLDDLCQTQISAHRGNTSESLRSLIQLPGYRDQILLTIDGMKAAGDTQAGDSLLNLLQCADASWNGIITRIPDAQTDTATVNEGSERRVRERSSTRFQKLTVHELRAKNLGKFPVWGGLGTVTVAEDLELERDVAFKEMRDECRAYSNHVDRFEREAKVTGRLEHPGIVPIYGFGLQADGSPYYAMRLIRGHTLKKAVERFHQRRDGGRVAASGPKRSDRRPYFADVGFRRMIAQFVDVCNAIDYSHGKGVLHRDIKPTNIMLGDYGETIVIDWGLAKPYGRALSEKGDERFDAPSILPAADDDSTRTRNGVFGSPSYMSPEQANGHLDDMDERSDVYQLGATLYEILTGRPPIDPALGKHDVIECARTGRFESPRKVNRKAPVRLSAICMKAMARQKNDRYPSASALANDIARWQADEPVSAYVEPIHRNILRWGRRHQISVTVLFTTLFAVAAAMLVRSHQLDRALAGATAAECRAVAQQEIAEKQKVLAERARDKALAARKAEEAAKIAAIEAKDAEETAKNAALKAQNAEKAARMEAVAAKTEADRNRAVADKARDEAVLAASKLEAARDAAVKAQKEAAAATLAAIKAREEAEKNATDAKAASDKAGVALKAEQLAKNVALRAGEAEKKAKEEAVRQKALAERNEKEAKRQSENALEVIRRVIIDARHRTATATTDNVLLEASRSSALLGLMAEPLRQVSDSQTGTRDRYSMIIDATLVTNEILGARRRGRALTEEQVRSSKELLEAALTTAQELQSDTSIHSLQDLAVIHQVIAEFNGARGLTDSARRSFSEAHRIWEVLFEKATPESETAIKLALARSHERIALIAQDREEQFERFSRAKELRESLEARTRTSPDIQRDISICYEKLAALTDGNERREFLRRALKIREQLTTNFALNSLYWDDYSNICFKLGEELRKAEKSGEALELYRKGQERLGESVIVKKRLIFENRIRILTQSESDGTSG